MLAYLPHQHCAAFPAVHTWYSAGQTPTPQAFLYNQEDALLCSFLQRKTTSSITIINELTSFLSPARVLPAVVQDRTCCSRYPLTCFLENSTFVPRRFHGDRCPTSGYFRPAPDVMAPISGRFRNTK